MIVPIKQAVLESLLLAAPLVSPYLYNKWNHAEVDGISNKKDLDLYKKNNPNYENYDSVGKMTKVGAGVGLASGALLNGVLTYQGNKFGDEFDPAMGAFFMAAPTLLGATGGLVIGGINKLNSKNSLA